MFYYKDKNEFLVKSSKELNSDKLTPLTEQEYIELEATAAIPVEKVETSV